MAAVLRVSDASHKACVIPMPVYRRVIPNYGSLTDICCQSCRRVMSNDGSPTSFCCLIGVLWVSAVSQSYRCVIPNDGSLTVSAASLSGVSLTDGNTMTTITS